MLPMTGDSLGPSLEADSVDAEEAPAPVIPPAPPSIRRRRHSFTGWRLDPRRDLAFLGAVVCAWGLAAFASAALASLALGRWVDLTSILR